MCVECARDSEKKCPGFNMWKDQTRTAYTTLVSTQCFVAVWGTWTVFAVHRVSNFFSQDSNKSNLDWISIEISVKSTFTFTYCDDFDKLIDRLTAISDGWNSNDESWYAYCISPTRLAFAYTIFFCSSPKFKRDGRCTSIVSPQNRVCHTDINIKVIITLSSGEQYLSR